MGDLALRAFTAVIALVCLVALVRVAATVGLALPFDPNEGWNAYHSQAAMEGGALYPDSRSFLFNNYPPLSFYIVGVVGNLIGDDIVAGRIISLLALFGVAGGIFAVLRRLGVDCVSGLFAALLFPAGLIVFTDYVGMDDPQLLGHAADLCGLLLLLHEPRATIRVVGAALVFVFAGFIKHNLVALPAALALWLAIYDRRSAARFVTTGLAFCAIGFVAFRLTYGIDLLSQLNSPRTYSLAAFGFGVSSWLAWGGISLLGTAALFVLAPCEKFAVLCALYAVIAVALGAGFVGGAGVDMNAWFDAAIALALSAGLLLDRLPVRPWLRSAIAVLYTLPFVAGLAIQADGRWLAADYWLHPLAGEAAAARDDVAFIRSRGGPALCEMMSLCYWADVPATVDVFNLGQAYATHTRNDGDLVRLIDAKYFRTAQFDSMTEFALTPGVKRAFARSYRVARSDDLGVFLVPR